MKPETMSVGAKVFLITLGIIATIIGIVCLAVMVENAGLIMLFIFLGLVIIAQIAELVYMSVTGEYPDD